MKRTLCLLLVLILTLSLAACGDKENDAAGVTRGNRIGDLCYNTTLTEIEGIGPTRAKALLRQFGSLRGIQNASLEELLLVKGMTRPAAEAIQRYFESKG